MLGITSDSILTMVSASENWLKPVNVAVDRLLNKVTQSANADAICDTSVCSAATGHLCSYTCTSTICCDTGPYVYVLYGYFTFMDMNNQCTATIRCCYYDGLSKGCWRNK